MAMAGRAIGLYLRCGLKCVMLIFFENWQSNYE